MDLKSKSVKQLKKIAELANLTNYEDLSKSDLISLIESSLTEPSEVLTVIKKPLTTFEKKSLRTLLLRYNLSAEEFIHRYPNHPKNELLKQL